MDDELAKEVAAALLESVGKNRPQPRSTRPREKAEGFTAISQPSQSASLKAKTRDREVGFTRQQHVAVEEGPSGETAEKVAVVPDGVSQNRLKKTTTLVGIKDRLTNEESASEDHPEKYYETCAPLMTAVHMRTPCEVGAVRGAGAVPSPYVSNISSPAALGGGLTTSASLSTYTTNTMDSTCSMMMQYKGNSQRRGGGTAVLPFTSAAAEEEGRGGGGVISEEVQQLMRCLEDEKRRNKRFLASIQALEHEVSLFRSRRQTFVSIVGFKLFNATSTASSGGKNNANKVDSNPRVSSSKESSPSNSTVAPPQISITSEASSAGSPTEQPLSDAKKTVASDEHVEFFIVVDKSVAPKYIVRHRFNHFKRLHQLLSSGSFKTRSTCLSEGNSGQKTQERQQKEKGDDGEGGAGIMLSKDIDGRVTPWRSGGYYNATTTDFSDVASGATSSDNCSSISVIMARPSPSDVSLAREMMPSLPTKEGRGLGVSVGGLFKKIGNRIGGKGAPREEGTNATPPSSGKSDANKTKSGDKRMSSPPHPHAHEDPTNNAVNGCSDQREMNANYMAHVSKTTGISLEELPFLERRAKMLQIYLRQLLSIELFAESDVMAAFFTPDDPFFRDDCAPQGGDLKAGGKVGADRSSSVASERSGTEGGHYLAPPSSAQAGRISPGGDFIFPGHGLAVLKGEEIPHRPVAVAATGAHSMPGGYHSSILHSYGRGGGFSPSISPMSTPYMSRNLPTQQQAASIAQQQQQQQQQNLDTNSTGNSGTWSGPLDANLFQQYSGSNMRRPTPRLGGGSLPNVQTLSGQLYPARADHTSPSPSMSMPSGYLNVHQNNNYRTESPFTHFFLESLGNSQQQQQQRGGGGSFINPHEAAFKSLVIVSDSGSTLASSDAYPLILGGDAIALKRRERKREGATVLETTAGSAEEESARRYLVPTAANNPNFSLLLSALGFNRAPVFGTNSHQPSSFPYAQPQPHTRREFACPHPFNSGRIAVSSLNVDPSALYGTNSTNSVPPAESGGKPNVFEGSFI